MRLFAVVILSLAMTLGAPGRTPAQIVEIGGLSLALNQLMDRAQRLIQDAQNAGQILEVQAGGQAVALIDYARQAYAVSLHETSGAVSAQQQQMISGIQGLLDGIESHTLKSVDDIASRAHAIVNTIPFANRFPQLLSFRNLYVTATSPELIPFEVRGNFFDAAKEGYAPTLVVEGKALVPSSSITTAFTFYVPRSLVQGTPPQKVEYIPARLVVPFSETCGLIFDCKREAVFNFSFVSLPSTPGKFVIKVDKATTKRTTAPFTSREFVQDSSQDDIELVHCQNLADGWKFDVNSARYEFSKTTFSIFNRTFVAERRQGDQGKDWFDLGNQSTSTAACWKFKTLHKALTTSGKLWFTLSGTMYKDDPATERTEFPVEMKWGESRSIAIDPSAGWTLTYTSFDERPFDFNKSGMNPYSPYVRVESVGNFISIKALPGY